MGDSRPPYEATNPQGLAFCPAQLFGHKTLATRIGTDLCDGGHAHRHWLEASSPRPLGETASAAAKHGYAYRTPYSAAKFGVIGLTQSLAKELGPDNIRVNALLPGIIEGPRMEGVIRDRAEATGVNIDDMRNTYLKNISLRRMTSPKDVATTVAFLVSDLGFNLSGQSLGVDGNVENL